MNPKITFGSNADWKTQAALAQPQNVDFDATAYRMRQHELDSKQVNLEQTNYDNHLPFSKVNAVPKEDDHVTDPPKPKGLGTAEDFK